MGWRNWPYWLKGGVVLLVVYIVYQFRFFYLFDFFEDLPMFFIENLDITNMALAYIFTGLGYVLMFFIYFLVGALIGWIYGKIRARRAEQVKGMNYVRR
ncbi:hypothetical protein CMI47_16675 [Candidatus Pacearchaeota archaeon]|nr:hypothetical protein [Candidatus Pacearchaeota archaeon]